MPVIQVSQTEANRQIEDFPVNCKRSHLGSMHIRPGATKIVTDGELKHLSSIGIRLAVTPEAKESPEKAPVVSEASSPAPAVASDDTPSSGPTQPWKNDKKSKSGKKGSKS